MVEQTAPIMFGTEGNLGKSFAEDSLYAVMLGQGFVQKGVVGINEFKDAPVFGKNIIEEATGLLSHGLFQVIRIVGFVLFRDQVAFLLAFEDEAIAPRSFRPKPEPLSPLAFAWPGRAIHRFRGVCRRLLPPKFLVRHGAQRK